MNWQAPGDFLNKLVYYMFNLQRKYNVWGGGGGGGGYFVESRP